MSEPSRFLFDECIGRPVMEDVFRLSGTKAQFTHIIDYLGAQGVPDRTWVPGLAAEGGWVVITSDGGKQSVKRDKLPAICLEFGLMHVVLSSRLHQLRSRDKAVALVGLWAEIEAAAANPQSLRYLLAVKDQRGRRATLAFQLRPVDVSPVEPPSEATEPDADGGTDQS